MKKLLPFLLLLWLTACAPRVYLAPNFSQTVQPRHKMVAILPFNVHIKPAPQLAGIGPRPTQKSLAEQEYQTGLAVQNNVFSWLLQRASKNDYTVEFQDVARTNTLLQQAGLSYEDVQDRPREEIARILGVDAVVTGQLLLNKPLPLGVALAINVFTPYYAPSDEVLASLSLNDEQGGRLLWKYDCNLQGGGGTVLTTPQDLTNALMRNAAKRFPYRR
ncbi:hypothetical protein CDA63_01305 [Hymenobacter amundsenii]|uniref:Lipoprotein n=1 Tax=Hymenobacter amundsenii TaxID=2006685 RepID=A0A246FTD1_9BACT|nr:hypothetical protein [Hymenobacter amundsenii]OWP65024.1 hypothetical protein CDA63_01305 [Hymenobacter amundsenii]